MLNLEYQMLILTRLNICPRQNSALAQQFEIHFTRRMTSYYKELLKQAGAELCQAQASLS